MYKIIQFAPYKPKNGIVGAVSSIAGTAASVAGGMAQAEGLEDQAAAVGQAIESYRQGTLFNYRISKINESRIKKATKIEQRAIDREAARQNLTFQENRRRAVVQARSFRETQKAAMSDSGLQQGTGSMLDIEADTAANIAQVLGDMSYENTIAQTQAQYARRALKSQSVFERMNLMIQRRADIISAEGQIAQMLGQQQGLLASAEAAKIGAIGSAIDGIAGFAGGFKSSSNLATPNSFL
jgi:hypothetical protein